MVPFSKVLLQTLDADFENIETVDLKEIEEYILKSSVLPHVLVNSHNSIAKYSLKLNNMDFVDMDFRLPPD